MSEILTFAKVTRKFDAKIALKQVLNSKESKDFLIKLNTQKQLFDKGIGSDGISLESIGGSYTRATIEGTSSFEGKLQKGLPTDRITLFNEGDFYKSWQIEIKLPYIIFYANDDKEGVRLESRWGKNILGLTDENKRIFEDWLIDKVLDIILQRL